MHIVQNLNNRSWRSEKKVSGPSQFLIYSPNIYRLLWIFSEIIYVHFILTVFCITILLNNNTNIKYGKKMYASKIAFVYVLLQFQEVYRLG